MQVVDSQNSLEVIMFIDGVLPILKGNIPFSQAALINLKYSYKYPLIFDEPGVLYPFSI